MCYMWNGELKHGRPPNLDLDSYYSKPFVNSLLSEKDARGFLKYKKEATK